MQSLSHQIDEQTKTDVVDIADLRRLTEGQTLRLVQALAGTAAGRHDGACLVAAHALHMLALVGPETAADRGDFLVECCLDPRVSGRSALTSRLSGLMRENETDGADTASFALPGLAFRLTSRQIAEALAFVHFLLVADGLQFFADVKTALDEIETGESRLETSVQTMTRALGRVVYAYRMAHFPEQDLMRRNGALAAYVLTQEGGEKGFSRASDAVILGAWLHLVDNGERTLFETVARRCLQLERAIRERRTRSRVHADQALDVIGDLADGDGLSTGPDETDLGPAGWIAEIPDSPKVLTGPERDLLTGILSLAPLHRDRTLTVLRSQVFSSFQDRLARQLGQQPGKAPKSLQPDRDYAAQLAASNAVLGHLVNVAVLLVEASNGPDGESGVSLPKRQRIRREGFDAPLDEIAAALAPSRSAIAQVIGELRHFNETASAHCGRHAEDLPIFTEAFHRLFSVLEKTDDLHCL
ncbi:hypothetical protein HDIA_3353 [Hartmannibacter diazotrophicus]|uniref:Uncharacterized protein n=1 Tax=Hartmannibacter diazotrophicus TaxID=1482074 RepID=A0A2C9D985_9HYPH|nr:hypothetical protein [Hartmannibacter diazotrophicus]SON56894.1 hypothetical protein HDIA_3353 [Hartmannibacter diazotrophicus]